MFTFTSNYLLVWSAIFFKVVFALVLLFDPKKEEEGGTKTKVDSRYDLKIFKS